MKKLTDLTPYSNILPYDSEIFGVYQPMIGWRSRRTRARITSGFSRDLASLLNTIKQRFKPEFEIALNADKTIASVSGLAAGRLASTSIRPASSLLVDTLRANLTASSTSPTSTEVAGLITQDNIQRILADNVLKPALDWYDATLRSTARTSPEPATLNAMMAEQLYNESVTAGYLLFLKENSHIEHLSNFFLKSDIQLDKLKALLPFRDPLDYFDPFKDLDRVSLSPLGIVHLFRQYFYEFDTFLGPPVSHVWLSPGSVVELLEVSTRRTLTERTFESEFETTLRKESELTTEDELSQAVKEDNRSDTKFGMNAAANQSWIGGSASASTSFDMGTTQSKAREVSHRHMRTQTEKLSTEIRKNFKSTFRTVTESTDTSSKRYVLRNDTPDLLNYELRRKMRQVGVQVQDIGTYLCWQTYVDDPGRQLGIAELVHLASKPDVGEVPDPAAIEIPQPLTTELPIDIPFVPQTSDTSESDMSEVYFEGVETNLDDNEGEKERIQWEFGGFVAYAGQPGYAYGTDGNVSFDAGGNDIRVLLKSVEEVSPGKIRFSIKVKHVNFKNVSPLRVTARITWMPTSEHLQKIQEEHDKKIADFNAKSRYEYKRAFVEAARERIKLASRIESRPYEDLREEERIVVYRMLIQEMLTKDLPMPDDQTRHVVAELLNTIFDIDKMLYFVAPEWWRPRLHAAGQQLGGIEESPDDSIGSSQVSSSTVFGQIKGGLLSQLITPDNTVLDSDNLVNWGGVGNRPDSYYITEESAPAKFGSSLGWLLQLDGDNMRNAFLNSPWVKAVIPVRPGKERAAMNWLQRLHVEGTEGLDDQYMAPAAQLAEIPHSGPVVTVRDAIFHLCDVVAAKHEASLQVGQYPSDEINDDNRVSATPVDKVYEHGFYPLQGGFRVQAGGEDFEVFDQWVEVLPTDQVVPVEVTYDPKTGRQV